MNFSINERCIDDDSQITKLIEGTTEELAEGVANLSVGGATASA